MDLLCHGRDRAATREPGPDRAAERSGSGSIAYLYPWPPAARNLRIPAGADRAQRRAGADRLDARRAKRIGRAGNRRAARDRKIEGRAHGRQREIDRG
jgi:hypothetical protein